MARKVPKRVTRTRTAAETSYSESRRNPFKSTKTERDEKKKDVRWFKPVRFADDGRALVHDRVFTLIERLMMRTSMRRQMALYHACLYDDTELSGLGPGAYEPSSFEPSQLAFNVVRQMVDTQTALVAKERPLPMPLTNKGDFKEQRRARQLGAWGEGMFEACGVWKTDNIVVRDASLHGTGIAFNYINDDTIVHERVFEWEVIVDPREAQHGNPRNFHLRRWVDRLSLIERFPDFAEQIESAEAKGAFDDLDIGYDDTCDLVLVVESWHLPSSPKAKDGAHAICIPGETLVFEEYKRSYPPFSVLRMVDAHIGWHGIGLGKLLEGLQFTINDNCLQVQASQNMAGNYVFLSDTGDVVAEQLDNAEGINIIRCAPGEKPLFESVQPGHPDKWAFIKDLIPWASMVTGVSQQSATATKPAGVTAAAALEHLSDEQGGRLGILNKNYDQYHVDTLNQFIDLAEDIQAAGGKVEAIATTKRGRRTTRPQKLLFKDVRLDRSSFTLQVWPTSLLPKTPAGRIQTVNDWFDRGFIDKDEARMLGDFPDLDGAGSLPASSRAAIEWALDRIQDESKYEAPDPNVNATHALALGMQAYLDAKVDGAPPRILQLLRKFIGDARRLKKKAEPPPPPAAAPPGGAPMPGGPPPTAPPMAA